MRDTDDRKSVEYAKQGLRLKNRQERIDLQTQVWGRLLNEMREHARMALTWNRILRARFRRSMPVAGWQGV